MCQIFWEMLLPFIFAGIGMVLGMFFQNIHFGSSTFLFSIGIVNKFEDKTYTDI